jgi:hypothetical protein
MRLGLIVSVIVLGVVILIGAAAYLIDKTVEPQDRNGH